MGDLARTTNKESSSFHEKNVELNSDGGEGGGGEEIISPEKNENHLALSNGVVVEGRRLLPKKAAAGGVTIAETATIMAETKFQSCLDEED